MRLIALQLLYTIAWVSGAVPQEVSSPPDIEVVSHKWTMNVFKPGVATRPAISSETIQQSDKPYEPLPPQVPTPNLSAKPPEPPLGITTRNVKVETFTSVSSAGSVAAPGSNPNRLPLPTDGSAVRIERKELHVYSMELSNDRPKAIKALAWDFIFANPHNNAEELRHSFANLQKIDVGEKKTVRFTTALAPPKVVDATALGKNPKASFSQYVTIQCVLFADGITWERPEATGKPCDRLQRWIELRKKSQIGVEDLPFNP